MVRPRVLESGGLRFEGWIAGLGTTAGLRVVIGRWTSSPWGPFTDVMVEQPDGHRVLLAPQPAVAEFIAGTYQFDDVRTVGVDQGSLAPVTPPVRFGFGSTPPAPSLVRVITLIRPA
ncbi:MAG: hypothetical protein ACRDQ4_16090 [Pseudonocardiaceae bacterium]